MRCRKCHTDAFLFRNLCAACAPELHGFHDRAMEATRVMTAHYEIATGKKALENWHEYEAWLSSNINDPLVNAAAVEFCNAEKGLGHEPR